MTKKKNLRQRMMKNRKKAKKARPSPRKLIPVRLLFIVNICLKTVTNSIFLEKAFKNSSDVKKYDYLLGMSMWMLTEEKKNELLKQRDNKMAELDVLKRKTNADLWREDLDVFVQKLGEVEEKERRDELGVKKEKKEPVSVYNLTKLMLE